MTCDILARVSTSRVSTAVTDTSAYDEAHVEDRFFVPKKKKTYFLFVPAILETWK